MRTRRRDAPVRAAVGHIRADGALLLPAGRELPPLRATAAGTVARMTITCEWRGGFTNDEVNRLHAEAFETRVFDESEWNWRDLTAAYSLGWVVARREGGELMGFVNVLWDGLVHAWLQDTMVSLAARHEGVGTALVAEARAGSRAAGCEWLHVDFDDHLRAFYFDACGFRPTNAGLIALQE